MKNTIKLFSMMILAAGLLMVQPVAAQTDKQQKKENKEYQKQHDEIRKSLDQKSIKSAAKAAKKLEKEGWKTMNMPIDKQLEETWILMSEKDPNHDHMPRYIYASGKSTANTYAAAQFAAVTEAKVRIAAQIGSSIASLAEQKLANEQFNATEAASITKAFEDAKIIVSQKLGRTFTPREIYRVLSNGNFDVEVTVFYDMKTAVSIAREVMLEELQKESDINKAQLESLMGIDKIMEQVSKDMPQYDEIAQ